MTDQKVCGANLLADDITKHGVTQQKPPARRDTVSLVLEFIRPKGIEWSKEILLNKLRMEACDAIDSVTSHYCQACHVHSFLSVLLNDGEQSHLLHYVLGTRIMLLHELK